MRTVIGINNLISIDQYAYANHLQWVHRLGILRGQAQAKGEENIEFILCNPRRMTIDRMRNEAAKIAMESESDYLMFVDDDVLLDVTNIEPFMRLKSHGKDIVAGVTHIRGYPYHPMIFNFTLEEYKGNSYVDDYKEKADQETGLLKCDAIGFSCCLIKVELLRKMVPPFFVTSPNQTEDVFFCKRAVEQVPNTEIYVDTKVITGHLLGNDIVDPNNVEMWRKFDESRVEGLKDREANEKKRIDRDPKRLGKMVEALSERAHEIINV